MPTAAWQWIGWIALAVAVLWLLFAAWGDRSRGRRRCPKCWYDLQSAGDPPLTCPECGREFTELKRLHRPRCRKGHALAALGLMLVGYASIATPRVQATGWRGAVPTTVLVVAAPWLPQSWHDTEFYRTGIDDESHTRGRRFMQEVMNESARIVAGTPDTLAEELACRWADEPLLVQRVANHLWEWAYGSPRKPWYWNHGIDPKAGSGVMSMAWELRQKSLYAGALSHRQARETRALALSRYPHPRLRHTAEHSLVPLQTFPAALQCRSPDAASFEAALLDDSGEVLNVMVGRYDHDRGSITGVGDVGPIPYGTNSATIRYTLLDAAGDVIDRHTVRYQIDFMFTLEEFEALPREHQNIEWVTQMTVAEVNGTPVEKPRLP